MQKILIFTDGGARGNPGPAGIGAVVQGEDGEVFKEISEYIGEATNNVAEYEALIAALRATRDLFREKLHSVSVEVRMDSELIVRQMNGIYKVKEPSLKERFGTVAQMRQDDFGNLIFTHIPREKNKHADRLVNEAIDAAR